MEEPCSQGSGPPVRPVPEPPLLLNRVGRLPCCTAGVGTFGDAVTRGCKSTLASLSAAAEPAQE